MGWAALSAAANRVAYDRLGSASVIAGATVGRGFLQQNSELALGGEVVFIDYLLVVETSIFGGLTYGDGIIVDGTNYRVEHQPLRFDDGTFCRVPLVLDTAGGRYLGTLNGLRLITQDGRYLVTLN